MYYKKEIDYRTQAHTLTWISLPSFIPTTQILSLPHSFIPATQILSLSLSLWTTRFRYETQILITYKISIVF